MEKGYPFIKSWDLDYSVYEECYYYKLTKAGLYVERQKPIPLIWDNVKMECGFRCDIMIEKKVIIELKAIESLADIHLTKMLTYLRLSDTRLGLIFNFNVVKFKDGIRRVVNNL